MPEPSDRQCPLVDVTTEKLHPRGPRKRRHVLAQQDRDRIDLFAGRAAGNPYSYVLAGAPAREYLGNDSRFQGPEGIRIAKEGGDADQQVAKETGCLIGVVLQPIDIGIDIGDLQHLHAPLQATGEGLVPVLAEIVPEPAVQDFVDLARGRGDALALD